MDLRCSKLPGLWSFVGHPWALTQGVDGQAISTPRTGHTMRMPWAWEASAGPRVLSAETTDFRAGAGAPSVLCSGNLSSHGGKGLQGPQPTARVLRGSWDAQGTFLSAERVGRRLPWHRLAVASL